MSSKIKGENRPWLSFHIFHSGSLDRLLLQVVEPALVAATKRRLARMFFFVRYLEGGPHLRIRILPSNRGEIKSLHRFFMSSICKSLASSSGISSGANQQSEENFSGAPAIHDVPYVAETERYGGPVGVQLAEEHFWHSSIACLKLLKDSPDAPQELRLAMGIQLHFPFLYALQLDRSRMISLLEMFVLQWSTFPKVVQLRPADDQLNPAATTAWLEPYFKSLDANTLRTMRKFVMACECNVMTLPRFLLVWSRSCMVTTCRLISSTVCERPYTPTQQNVNPTTSIGPDRMFPLFLSYMHMTNNRLGVHNVNEAFLAFVLKRILETTDVSTGQFYD